MSIHQSAFPFVNRLVNDREDADNQYGFTKMEMASLMIAPEVLRSFTSWSTQSMEEAAEITARVAYILLQAADRYNP